MTMPPRIHVVLPQEKMIDSRSRGWLLEKLCRSLNKPFVIKEQYLDISQQDKFTVGTGLWWYCQ